MINRVYGKHKDRVYSGISIHKEWRYLSKFIEWVDSQPNKDWQNCDLDKDILVFGNKHYSPETCVFITSELNVFATERSSDRGEYLIGVDYVRKSGKYRAQCSNPWGRTKSERRGRIGLFPTEEDAHFAWKAKKHEYSCKWADLQSDPRVAQALRTRYADLTTPYIP